MPERHLNCSTPVSALTFENFTAACVINLHYFLKRRASHENSIEKFLCIPTWARGDRHRMQGHSNRTPADRGVAAPSPLLVGGDVMTQAALPLARHDVIL